MRTPMEFVEPGSDVEVYPSQCERVVVLGRLAPGSPEVDVRKPAKGEDRPGGHGLGLLGLGPRQAGR